MVDPPVGASFETVAHALAHCPQRCCTSLSSPGRDLRTTPCLRSYASSNRSQSTKCFSSLPPEIQKLVGDASVWLRTFLCRANPARRIATGANADRLQISRVVMRLHHRHARRTPTTIDAPMEAQMPTSMHCHSSGGRPRTLPLWPCCCVAAWSSQPLKSGVCKSS
jgi:hypothetical protein